MHLIIPISSSSKEPTNFCEFSSNILPLRKVLSNLIHHLHSDSTLPESRVMHKGLSTKQWAVLFTCVVPYNINENTCSSEDLDISQYWFSPIQILKSNHPMIYPDPLRKECTHIYNYIIKRDTTCLSRIQEIQMRLILAELQGGEV